MLLSKFLTRTKSPDHFFALSLLLCASLHTQAESGRADYDLDDNGLIEINDLADLSEIRNNLDGSSLYGVSNGCPVGGCTGFELTTDLDFDTNGDGVMDASDSYWNGGAGWEPIGSYTDPFTGTFDGRGHVIRNLFINRPTTTHVSLFGTASIASFYNLGLTGALMSITGKSYVGTLASDVYNTTISGCYASGKVSASGNFAGGLIATGEPVTIIDSHASGDVYTNGSYVGGLAAYVYISTISTSYATGKVEATGSQAGGLVGFAETSGTNVTASFATGAVTIGSAATNAGGLIGNSEGTITASYATGSVTGGSNLGGLVGYSYSSSRILASYATGRVSGTGSNLGGLVGSAGNAILTNSYWATDNSGMSTLYGSAGAGVTDSGNAGVLLSELTCPTAADDTSCASSTLFAGWGSYVDSEGASYWDFGTSLQLPGLRLNGVTYRDSDSDSVLDQDDTFPYDPSEWVDSDSDLVGDNADAFPNDPSETTDSDHDGVGDNSDYFPNDGTGTQASDDVDLDDNGLIEIDSLADLDAIRVDLSKTSLNGVTAGCPVGGCTGFELTTDLDFDTNGDGVMDASDSYWNGGAGWAPIGSSGSAFSATFDGNGHVIRNLFINRPSATNVGLFSYLNGAQISNLGLTGDLMSIVGSNTVGALAANADDSIITRCYATGPVHANDSYLGGLIGYGQNAQIVDSWTTGDVSGRDTVGGLAGDLYASQVSGSYATGAVTGTGATLGGLVGYLEESDSSITASFATGAVTSTGDSSSVGGLVGDVYAGTITASYTTGAVRGGSNIGSLVGRASSGASIVAAYAIGKVTASNSNAGGLVGSLLDNSVFYSHWATDTTGNDTLQGDTGSSPILTGNAGALLSQLKCPTTADDTACASSTLFSGWASYVDSEGASYWDFGNSNQLPGLRINGAVYRDTDGDGVWDFEDKFPFDASEWADSDSDLVGDNADAFPNDPSETADTDSDGIGDNSDPDIDGDGVDNASDLFPYDGTETLDTDSDGVGDNADVDADGNGLIEIASLAALDNIRNNLSGSAYNDGSGDNSAGCGDGDAVTACNGYELTTELDFDTNGDGAMDANDTYWNSGAGWTPLGSSAKPFTAIFNGQGHRILNFYLNRAKTYQGLFGYTANASLQNLGLDGPLMSVNGAIAAGGLAGYTKNTTITSVYSTGAVSGGTTLGGLIGVADGSTLENCYATGKLTSYGDSVGGLIGSLDNGSITGCFATGQVSATSDDSFNVGGLVGRLNGANLSASFATGKVTGSDHVGGLVGYATATASISASYAVGAVYGSSTPGGVVGFSQNNATYNSYWATDSSGQSNSGNENADDGYLGATLAQLQCPTAADDSSCVAATTLYQGWSALVDSEGNAYWDFGNAGQLPGLNLNGVVYRDSDGDGLIDSLDPDDDNDLVADVDDAFPNDPSETTDADGDGIGDNADPDDDNDNVADADDAFPFDASEWADNDHDGTGDNADSDDDNDTIADADDAFPFDATESADNDGDGIGDNADPDDDNDNVADADDAFPFDASESADFDQDGTGDNADSDDDNDNLSDAYELQYGLNPYDASDASADLDGDGVSNLEEYVQNTDPTADDIAPVLTVPADLTVNSTGATTVVDLGVATAVDAKDGTITPNADQTGPFAPGHYVITWSAADEAGNTATATQTLDVIPQVSVMATQTLEEGGAVTVTVTLNGSAVNYPVTVPFSVSGTAVYPADHDLVNGSIEIAAGLTGSVSFNTLADGVFEGTETVVITLGTPTNAIRGGSSEQVVSLTEANVAPSVSLRFIQGGEQVSSVYADRGLVTVEAVLVDPNVNDAAVMDWSQTASELSPGSGWQTTSYSLDPSNLQGTYAVAARVTDSGGESASASTTLRILATSPSLSSAQDTDGDGISDADEGVADANGNRIVDYLDPVTSSDLLPTNGAGPTMQVQTGHSLALGDIAYGLGLTISELTLADIVSYTGESLATESGLQFLSGIFDFEVHGLAQGGSTQLVIPLSAAIPKDAQYLKYWRGLGWANFVEDASNTLSSAPGALGVCPAPGSSDYTSGLSEGNFCVQLTLVDGGPNDEDGLANGVIKDPGAVATSFIAEPNVSANNSSLSNASFNAGDGEQVVLGFTLSSDSTDAALSALSLQASGDLDEVNDIGAVKVYRDANSNGIAEASELVASGSFASDNGSLTLTLDAAYQLPVGDTHILVTYQF